MVIGYTAPHFYQTQWILFIITTTTAAIMSTTTITTAAIVGIEARQTNAALLCNVLGRR